MVLGGFSVALPPPSKNSLIFFFYLESVLYWPIIVCPVLKDPQQELLLKDPQEGLEVSLYGRRMSLYGRR